jgi:phosphonate transport system substrate-binding protein
MKTSSLLLGLSLLIGTFACTSETPATTPGTAAAVKELRFTVIPDFNKAKLAESCQLFADYLAKACGVPVRYEPSADYTAAVNALVSNKVDFAWLGGKTTVDALDQGEGKVEILATRDIDLAFKTYFIANQKLVASGKLGKLNSLADLKPVAKELTFTFGDVNSTSGHLMPRHFLVGAGVDPEQAFKSSGYQASGGHASTLKAVASGASDLGALNFGYWDKASDEDKANAPIVFVTPDYVDYAWVVHQRLGQELIGKLRTAMLALDAGKPEQQAVLAAWGSKAKFVAADAKLWDSIRKVRDSLPKGFLK